MRPRVIVNSTDAAAEAAAPGLGLVRLVSYQADPLVRTGALGGDIAPGLTRHPDPPRPARRASRATHGAPVHQGDRRGPAESLRDVVSARRAAPGGHLGGPPGQGLASVDHRSSRTCVAPSWFFGTNWPYSSPFSQRPGTQAPLT